MQASTSAVLRTSLLVSIYVFFLMDSLANAIGVGRRKPLAQSAVSQAGGTVSKVNTGRAAPAAPTVQLNLIQLPFVLPSGTNVNGQFNAKIMVGFIPFKLDAINFYKLTSASLYNEMVAFVDYLDLLATRHPSNAEQLKAWQRQRQGFSLKRTKKVGEFSAAFDRNDLSFLDIVSGPGLTRIFKINYQIKLPTPTTTVFSKEILDGFKAIWQAAQTANNLPTGSYSSTDIVLRSNGDIFTLYYPPMFDSAAIQSKLDQANALAHAWKGVSAQQFKRFFETLHEYKIMRLHELIMSTLPDPKGSSVSSGTNLFLAPIPGIIFNMQFSPTLSLQDIRQLITVQIGSRKTLERQPSPVSNSKYELLRAVEVLSSYLKVHYRANALGQTSNLYTAFQELTKALQLNEDAFRYGLIQATLDAIKADTKIISDQVKQVFKAFTLVEQVYSVKSATYLLAQDILNKQRAVTNQIYGDVKYGTQWEQLGVDQVQLKYSSVLSSTDFKRVKAPIKFQKEYDALAKVLENLDLYLINYYIYDLKTILSEQKKVQIILSPSESTQGQSLEVTQGAEQTQGLSSQNGMTKRVSAIPKPPRKRNQIKGSQIATSQSNAFSGQEDAHDQMKPPRQAPRRGSQTETAPLNTFSGQGRVNPIPKPPRKRNQIEGGQIAISQSHAFSGQESAHGAMTPSRQAPRRGSQTETAPLNTFFGQGSTYGLMKPPRQGQILNNQQQILPLESYPHPSIRSSQPPRRRTVVSQSY